MEAYLKSGVIKAKSKLNLILTILAVLFFGLSLLTNEKGELDLSSTIVCILIGIALLLIVFMRNKKRGYTHIGEYCNGYYLVMNKGKFGFIDDDDNVIVPIGYDAACPFSHGVAAVKKDGKWGYIDKSGKVTIPFKYDLAEPFVEERAIVKRDNTFFYIDREGKSGDTIPPAELAAFRAQFADSLAKRQEFIKKERKKEIIIKVGGVVLAVLYAFWMYVVRPWARAYRAERLISFLELFK